MLIGCVVDYELYQNLKIAVVSSSDESLKII